MKRYTRSQIDVLKVLRKTGTSPCRLAGHWYFGEPLKGAEHLPKPELPEKVMNMVSASWHVSKHSGGSDSVITRHIESKAAVICSGLLYEALFPDEFKSTDVSTVTEESAKAGVERLNGGNAISWFAEHMHQGSWLRIALSDLTARDCVRLSRPGAEEGTIENFERMLEEEATPQPARP